MRSDGAAGRDNASASLIRTPAAQSLISDVNAKGRKKAPKDPRPCWRPLGAKRGQAPRLGSAFADNPDYILSNDGQAAIVLH
jgi:hypothetical protein